MDARTSIDTQVIGHELNRKRAQAAGSRLAAQARRDATASQQTRGRPGRGSYAVAMRVVAAVITALLAVALLGQAIAPQFGETARGSGAQQQLVMGGRSAQQYQVAGRAPAKHRIARGRAAPFKYAMARGRSTAATQHLMAFRKVAHKHAAM